MTAPDLFSPPPRPETPAEEHARLIAREKALLAEHSGDVRRPFAEVDAEIRAVRARLEALRKILNPPAPPVNPPPPPRQLIHDGRRAAAGERDDE